MTSDVTTKRQPADFLEWYVKDRDHFKDEIGDHIRNTGDRVCTSTTTFCFNRGGPVGCTTEPHTLGDVTLFRGKSGSGKTTAVNSSIHGAAFEHIKPILDAFGNRPTPFNPDSSRHARVYYLDKHGALIGLKALCQEKYPEGYTFLDHNGKSKDLAGSVSGFRVHYELGVVGSFAEEISRLMVLDDVDFLSGLVGMGVLVKARVSTLVNPSSMSGLRTMMGVAIMNLCIEAVCQDDYEVNAEKVIIDMFGPEDMSKTTSGKIGVNGSAQLVINTANTVANLASVRNHNESIYVKSGMASRIAASSLYSHLVPKSLEELGEEASLAQWRNAIELCGKCTTRGLSKDLCAAVGMEESVSKATLRAGGVGIEVGQYISASSIGLRSVVKYRLEDVKDFSMVGASNKIFKMAIQGKQSALVADLLQPIAHVSYESEVKSLINLSQSVSKIVNCIRVVEGPINHVTDYSMVVTDSEWIWSEIELLGGDWIQSLFESKFKFFTPMPDPDTASHLAAHLCCAFTSTSLVSNERIMVAVSIAGWEAVSEVMKASEGQLAVSSSSSGPAGVCEELEALLLNADSVISTITEGKYVTDDDQRDVIMRLSPAVPHLSDHVRKCLTREVEEPEVAHERRVSMGGLRQDDYYTTILCQSDQIEKLKEELEILKGLSLVNCEHAANRRERRLSTNLSLIAASSAILTSRRSLNKPKAGQPTVSFMLPTDEDQTETADGIVLTEEGDFISMVSKVRPSGKQTGRKRKHEADYDGYRATFFLDPFQSRMVSLESLYKIEGYVISDGRANDLAIMFELEEFTAVEEATENVPQAEDIEVEEQVEVSDESEGTFVSRVIMSAAEAGKKLTTVHAKDYVEMQYEEEALDRPYLKQESTLDFSSPECRTLKQMAKKTKHVFPTRERADWADIGDDGFEDPDNAEVAPEETVLECTQTSISGVTNMPHHDEDEGGELDEESEDGSSESSLDYGFSDDDDALDGFEDITLYEEGIFCDQGGVHDPQLDEIVCGPEHKPLVLSEYCKDYLKEFKDNRKFEKEKIPCARKQDSVSYMESEVRIIVSKSGVYLQEFGKKEKIRIGWTYNYKGPDFSAEVAREGSVVKFGCVMDSNNVKATRLGMSSRAHAFASFVIQQSFSNDHKSNCRAILECQRGDVVITMGPHRITVDPKGKNGSLWHPRKDLAATVDKYMLIKALFKCGDTKAMMRYSMAEEDHDPEEFIRSSVLQPTLEGREKAEHDYCKEMIGFSAYMSRASNDKGGPKEVLKDFYKKYVIEHPPNEKELITDARESLTVEEVSANLRKYIRDNNTHKGTVKYPSQYTVVSSDYTEKFLSLCKETTSKQINGKEVKMRGIDPLPWCRSTKMKSDKLYDFGRDQYAFNKSTYHCGSSEEKYIEDCRKVHLINVQPGRVPKPEVECQDKSTRQALKVLLKTKAFNNLHVYSRLFNRIQKECGSYFDQACGVGICWSPATYEERVALDDNREKVTEKIGLSYNVAFFTQGHPEDCGVWSRCIQNDNEFHLSPTRIMSLRDIHYNAALSVRIITSYTAMMSAEKMHVARIGTEIESSKVRHFMWVMCTVSRILRDSSWKTSEYYADSRFITLCSLGGGGGDPLGMVNKMSQIESESQDHKQLPLSINNSFFIAQFSVQILKEKRWCSKKCSPLLGLPLRHAALEKDLPNAMQWHIRGTLHSEKCTKKLVDMAVTERKQEVYTRLLEHQKKEIEFSKKMRQGSANYEEFSACLENKEPIYSHIASAALCQWAEPELARLPKYNASAKFSLPEMVTDHHCANFKEEKGKMQVRGSKVHDDMKEILDELGLPPCAYSSLLRILDKGERATRSDWLDAKPAVQYLFHIHAKDQKGGNRDISQMNVIHRFIQMYIESVMEAVCGSLDADMMTVTTSKKAGTFADMASDTLQERGTLSSKDKSHFCGHMVTSYMGLHVLNMSAPSKHLALVSAGGLLINEQSRRVFITSESPATGIPCETYSEHGHSKDPKDAESFLISKNMMQGIFAKTAAAVANVAVIGTRRVLASCFSFFSLGSSLTTSDDEIDALPGYCQSFIDKLPARGVSGVTFEGFTDRSVQMLFTLHLSMVLGYMMAKENLRKLMILKCFAEFNNFLVTRTGVVPQESIQVFQNLQPLDGLSFFEDLGKVMTYARSSLMWGNSPDTVMMTLESGKELLRAKYKLRRDVHMKPLKAFGFLPDDLPGVLVDHSKDNSSIYRRLKEMEAEGGSKVKEAYKSIEDEASLPKRGFFEPDPVVPEADDEVTDEEEQRLEMMFKRHRRSPKKRDMPAILHPSAALRSASKAILRSRKVALSSVVTRYRILSIKQKAGSRDGFFDVISSCEVSPDRKNSDVIGSYTKHAVVPSDYRPTKMNCACSTNHIDDLKRSFLYSQYKFEHERPTNNDELEAALNEPGVILGMYQKSLRRKAPTFLLVDCVSGLPKGRGLYTGNSTSRPRTIRYSLDLKGARGYETLRQSTTIAKGPQVWKAEFIRMGGRIFELARKLKAGDRFRSVRIPFSVCYNEDGTQTLFYLRSGSSENNLAVVENCSIPSTEGFAASGRTAFLIPALEDFTNIPLHPRHRHLVSRFYSNRQGSQDFAFNYGSYCLTSHGPAVANLTSLYGMYDSAFPKYVMNKILPNAVWFPKQTIQAELQTYYNCMTDELTRLLYIPPRSNVSTTEMHIAMRREPGPFRDNARIHKILVVAREDPDPDHAEAEEVEIRFDNPDSDEWPELERQHDVDDL